MEHHFVDAPIEEWQKRDLWSLEEFVWLIFSLASVTHPLEDPTVATPDDVQRMEWLRDRCLRAVEAGGIDVSRRASLPHEILAAPGAWAGWANKNKVEMPDWMRSHVPNPRKPGRKKELSDRRFALVSTIEKMLEEDSGKSASDIARWIMRHDQNQGYKEATVRKCAGEQKKLERN